MPSARTSTPGQHRHHQKIPKGSPQYTSIYPPTNETDPGLGNSPNSHLRIQSRESVNKDQSGLQPEAKSLFSCMLCQQYHPRNCCPLQFSKIQRCQLCRFKHTGLTPDCRKGGSEARIRLMLDLLSTAKAPKEKIDNANLHLRNELARISRRKRERQRKEYHERVVNALRRACI